MAELQENLNNRERCLEILAELKAHRHAGRAGMPQIIAHVERICASFAKDEPDRRIAQYRRELETQCEESIQYMKKTVGWLTGSLFDQTYENLRYFYLRSADHLEMLNHPDARQIHPMVDRMADDLLRYIQTPGGSIHNQMGGILGSFMVLFGQGRDGHRAFTLAINLHHAGAEEVDGLQQVRHIHGPTAIGHGVQVARWMCNARTGPKHAREHRGGRKHGHTRITLQRFKDSLRRKGGLNDLMPAIEQMRQAVQA
jgi:hypothetical protein